MCVRCVLDCKVIRSFLCCGFELIGLRQIHSSLLLCQIYFLKNPSERERERMDEFRSVLVIMYAFALYFSCPFLTNTL